jgi:hypothetical protein
VVKTDGTSINVNEVSADLTNLTGGFRFSFKTQQNFVNTRVGNEETLECTAIIREWDLGQGSFTLLPYTSCLYFTSSHGNFTVDVTFPGVV